MSVNSKFIVKYADVDRMNRVYYARYLEYFEVGRTDFLNKYYVSYKELEDLYNIFMPVIDVYAKFFKPIEYATNLLLVTDMEKISNTKFIFNYQLFVKDLLVAKGYSTHVFIDNKNKVISFNDFLIRLKK